MHGIEPPETIIDELLREQQLLTPVARFARSHPHAAEPEQAHFYRDLIPLTAPGRGEQYAFEVDLDLCSGCKACVTACHNLNGLAEDETWRSVGLVHFELEGETRAQSITAACHHCIDPACLNGCPVDAYEKHPVTGVVKHLDDQCIGCQYCVLKCPYEVPRYNGQRGIVRKCDMCSDRLGVGEAPACVQACPNEAISITVVNSTAIRARYVNTDDFLPGAPPSQIALPSTQYISRKATLKREHGVSSPARVERAHPALAWMLVLTQLAVGAFCAAEFARMSGAGSQHALVASFAAAALLFGLVASVFHLGRPLYAFRAIVGWRHSWLSREVLAFGVFAACALLRLALPQSRFIGWLTIVCGFIAVMCSTMIYHDTQRPFWRGLNTAGKFFGAPILFAAVVLWILDPGGLAAAFVVLITGAKLAWEYRLARNPALARSRVVMLGQLKWVTLLRFALGIAGGVIGPLLAIAGWRSAAVVVGGFLLCFCGELAERHLFFAAAAPPKMPGS
jgi:Fe-S-cluster-containing dehydrogenase component/DMSO reductase anchor subunit